MPQQPKKSQEEWDHKKENIFYYYITQNKTLAETMSLMEETYNFSATKREYVRRLGIWQFSKNVKKSDWQIVHKRKAAHKETAIILNGQHIDPRKKQRGLSRHKQERDDSLFSILSSCSSTRGITTRSPSPGPNNTVLANNIPWFRFDQAFGCHLRCMVNEFIPKLKWTSLGNSLQAYYSPGDLALQKARQLLAQTLRPDPKSVVEFSSEILKRLESVLPQRRCTDQPLAPEPFFLLIQIHIYLSSNGNLSSYDMANFLHWISHKDNLPLFYGFLGRLRAIKNPNLEIFLNRLLLCAVELERETVLSSLLACGVDPNYNNHPFQGHERDKRWCITTSITPLQLAAVKGNPRICGLLLAYGANIDSLSCDGPFTPLELAISVHRGNISTVERLLAQGADMTLSCDDEITMEAYPQLFDTRCSKMTLLMKAIAVHNIDIARLLLRRGASPNDISYTSGTALQIAIMENDRAMVELLLENGAEVNMFEEFENWKKEYFIYRLEKYRQGWEGNLLQSSRYESHFNECTTWATLLSPIELATRQNNLPLVQRLIEKGATMNFSLDYSSIHDSITINLDPSEEPEFRDCLKEVTKETFPPILHMSILNGNVDLTRLLLQHGASAMVNCPDGSGRTPLQVAYGLEACEPWESHAIPISEVGQVRIDLTQLLVDFGANVNSPAGHINGRTALQAAAETGDRTLVEILIEKGGDLKASPGVEGGISTAEAAAKSGNLDLMMWLATYGIPLSDDICCIALHSAALGGNESATQRCLHMGADVDSVISPTDTPDIKETVLQASIRGGNIEVVQLLLRAGADTNALVQGETALCTAARAGDVEVLDILLHYHADPNLPGTRFTPLAIACSEGQVELVQRLLRAASNVNQLSQDPTHDSPTDVASPLLWVTDQLECIAMDSPFPYTPNPDFLDLEEISNLLLSHGANPNAGNTHHGSSILTTACRYMSYSFVEVLIACGANVKAADEDGVYPIQAAVLNRGDTVRLLQLLLDKGADINAPAPGYDGNYTVLGNALACTLEEKMGDFILNAGVDFNDRSSLLPELIENGWFKLAFDWVRDGVDVNCRGNGDFTEGSRMTALQAAVERGNTDLVKLLLDHGADVNAPPGYDSGTALQFAANNHDFNVVKLLIEHGADINAPAPKDRAYGLIGTALENAAQKGRLDIAHLLLDNDDQINTIESRCVGAAVIAENNGHKVLARTLREYKPQQSPSLSTRNEEMT